MSEVWSFIGAVALWMAISCGLWWLHRRRVRGRQNHQLEQAARAVSYVGEAQAVFDAIRSPVPLDRAPAATRDRLRAETHALLKRIQAHGAFFDKVNTLRVQIQASLGIEDHEPLSEILHLRRDLWAASEIILVEDPASFGPAFAEEAAYERFQAEAVELLFKRQDRAQADEDLMDLRLSLAHKGAESFTAELQEAIEAAREKDRLPTPAEIIAYPLAFFRAIPEALRTACAFLRSFLSYAAEAARTMRDSEAVARGASTLRQARDDWPQRLSAGFERASGAARDSATAVRRHYDFLVAAYDFQSKYEQLLQRTPEMTERGRQFIARLELAERSERLRLTSTNAAIWLARRLLSGLAHLIAAGQRLHGALRRTAPWAFAAAIIAPAPISGRRTSSFRSYRMALAAGGMSEISLEQRLRVAPSAPSHEEKLEPKTKETKTRAKKKERTAKRKSASPARIKDAPERKTPAAAKSAKTARRPEAKMAPPPPAENTKEVAAPVLEEPSDADKPELTNSAEATEERHGAVAEQKRQSFLSRLFGKSKPETGERDTDRSPISAAKTQTADVELAAETSAAAQADIPSEPPPTLMAKLSSIEEAEPEPSQESDDEPEQEARVEAEDADDPGPLTLSVMDLQAKMKPKAPQIRSFPWLRG